MSQTAKQVLIEGKVAQLLSARELVINKGAGDGVRQGMRFAVLAAEPLAIHDPDTGQVIDEIDREKVRVEATDVREKTAICATYEKVVSGGLAPALWLGASAIEELQRLTPRVERPVTLKAADSALPPPLSPEQSYVKIGDRVRQIVEPSNG
jgi:hypothetical protein